jgi:hypothetical protein
MWQKRYEPKSGTVHVGECFPDYCSLLNHFEELLALTLAVIGLYLTSFPVRKSGKLSKSGLSGSRIFSFPDAGLLEIEKNPKKN